MTTHQEPRPFKTSAPLLLLLLVWHAPLGVHSAKRRHQSPEWMILSHSYRLIQWEIVWSQVLLNSLHPRSSRTSWWFPPVLRRGSSYDTPGICLIWMVPDDIYSGKHFCFCRNLCVLKCHLYGVYWWYNWLNHWFFVQSVLFCSVHNLAANVATQFGSVHEVDVLERKQLWE